MSDSTTRKRRDYYLGEYDSPASRELYHRLVAEWESAGRRLPTFQGHEPNPTAPGITIVQLSREYWRWAEDYYHHNRAGAIKTMLRITVKYYGQTPAAEFGPRKLRLLREEMIRGNAAEKPLRQPWSRKYINSQVQCLRHMFKWAVARELLPVTAHQALCTLEPLKRGRSAARESNKVGPVPEYLIEATKKELTAPVRALVELQLLTGARPGELLGLRRCDLVPDEKTGIWVYRPDQHKNAFREKERIIYFGPRAQEELAPFMLNRPPTMYLFSPAESEAERRQKQHEDRTTPLSCGNRPGTNRREDPIRRPGDRYTSDSYRRAIEYACAKAFPLPDELAPMEKENSREWWARLSDEQKAQARAWRKQHRWHPHQLRHNAATEIRRDFGLEAAQLALGHASAQITDAIYAERDQAKVMEIMRKIG